MKLKLFFILAFLILTTSISASIVPTIIMSLDEFSTGQIILFSVIAIVIVIAFLIFLASLHHKIFIFMISFAGGGIGLFILFSFLDIGSVFANGESSPFSMKVWLITTLIFSLIMAIVSKTPTDKELEEAHIEYERQKAYEQKLREDMISREACINCEYAYRDGDILRCEHNNSSFHINDPDNYCCTLFKYISERKRKYGL